MRYLDYFLAPMSTCGLLYECEIVPATFSDHCPIFLKLQLNDGIRGPGLWKFNTSHLWDKEYVNQINEVLDYVEYRYENLNPLNKLEMLTHDVRQEISYSKYKAAERRAKKEKYNKQ